MLKLVRDRLHKCFGGYVSITIELNAHESGPEEIFTLHIKKIGYHEDFKSLKALIVMSEVLIALEKDKMNPLNASNTNPFNLNLN